MKRQEKIFIGDFEKTVYQKQEYTEMDLFIEKMYKILDEASDTKVAEFLRQVFDDELIGNGIDEFIEFYFKKRDGLEYDIFNYIVGVLYASTQEEVRYNGEMLLYLITKGKVDLSLIKSFNDIIYYEFSGYKALPYKYYMKLE